MTKTKTLINKLIHNLFIPINHIKTYIHLIWHYKDKDSGLSLDKTLILWLLDIIPYGLSLYVIYITLFIFTGYIKWLTLPIGLGLLRWYVLDLIRHIKKEIMN